MDKYIKQAKELIEKSNKIMVLSGAGLSTEAGIPDFRSQGGLYSQEFHGYNPEVILSHSFYNNNTDLFWEYLRTKLNYTGIEPDNSYKLIAELEKEGKIATVVTQNIDSLHKLAGSKNLLEIHGTLGRFYCDSCGKKYPPKELMDGTLDYNCSVEGCNGIIRPDVVLYDESVDLIIDAFLEAEKCDLLLVLGTSLRVYPVASIPDLFLRRGKGVIIINRDPTPLSMTRGVVEINAPIGKTLPKIFNFDDDSLEEEYD